MKLLLSMASTAEKNAKIVFFLNHNTHYLLAWGIITTVINIIIKINALNVGLLVSLVLTSGCYYDQVVPEGGEEV